MSRTTTIVINGKATPLNVIYRSNSVNVNIRIDAQQIKASAPKGYPLKQITALIEKNHDKIARELERQSLKENQFALKDQINIVGKSYRLVKVPGLAQARCEGEMIAIDPGKGKEQLSGVAYLKLRDYLAAKAQTEGVAIRGLRIGRYKSKWGSCNYRTRSLTFNGELAFLSLAIIDYVFYHEIAHLKHPNHSADFWQEVKGLMPEYQTIRKELKQVQI